jgi:K+-sensing histidine kinase KdpD
MGSVGLGLSVAHGIVRDHEGQLRIESTPNQGATIFLDLPIAFQAKAENDEFTT